MAVTLLIIVFIVLLILSGYFSSMETSFVSMSTLRIKQMIEDGIKEADTLMRLKRDQHKVIMTILIGNNIVNIAASAISTLITIELFGEGYIAVMTGVVTFLVLIFGEITPKTRAVVKYEEIAKKNAKIMSILLIIFDPVLKALEFLTGLLLRIEGIKNPRRSEESITEETVKKIVTLSEKEGSINETEKEMIHKIFEFNDTMVRHIMTPRTYMLAIDLNDDIEINISKVVESGFSRIPVYNRKLEKIIGILYTKDLLRFLKKNIKITKSDLKGILRPAYIIPEHMKIDALFREFRTNKTHIAVIVDEFGGVSGLVTLEDLVEEVFGEIYDETDEVEQRMKEISKKEYAVEGSAKLEDLNIRMGLDIDDSEGYDTISGFILDKLGRMPRKNEILIFENFTVKIQKIKDNRIELIKLEIKEQKKKSVKKN